MMQAKMDSLMEPVTNTAIGFIISWITWQVLVILLDLPIDQGTNLLITLIFTVVSVLRQYILRRIFNGRTPWVAIKRKFNLE